MLFRSPQTPNPKPLRQFKSIMDKVLLKEVFNWWRDVIEKEKNDRYSICKHSKACIRITALRGINTKRSVLNAWRDARYAEVVFV